MIDASIVLVATVAGISLFWLYSKRNASMFSADGVPLKYAPSVPWVPVFGSLPFLPPFPTMYRFFTKQSDKYKNVAAYYMMNKYRIMLNSREAIHEAFVKRSTDFADRPTGAVNDILNPNQKGILFHCYNEDFKKYHKMSLGIMKKFGFGNRIMEQRIMEEVLPLLETLAKYQGREVNPSPIITNCSMNVICGLLFGKRFDDDDPQLAGIISNLRESFRNLSKIFIINVFSFLRHFSYFKNALSNCVKAQEKVFAMLEDKIIECTDESNGLESFIGSYIETEGPQYDKDQLLHFLHEMFLAGTETTASTLEWSLVLLGNHPEVQEKMFLEMETIGNRCPSLDDKKNLPFCEAVFCEILRMKPVAPLTLPHVAMRDSHVMGFFIPKGTYVVGNLHSVHYSTELWGDPEKFKPDRFIEKDSLNTSARDQLVSFSLGKRSCFGEILAKQEVFLTLTNLVKRFVILPPVGQKEIVVDDVMDVTSKPSPFTVRIVERSHGITHDGGAC